MVYMYIGRDVLIDFKLVTRGQRVFRPGPFVPVYFSVHEFIVLYGFFDKPQHV